MSGRMTARARARIIRDCLLRHGVPEVSIELQVGRPSSADDWNACKPVGVMSHHIASRPTVSNPTPGLSLVKRGRSDLPGPLANGYAGMDLVYRILTLGYANHPGYGGALRLSGPMGAFVIPKDNARPYMWGTEFEGGYDDAVWDRKYKNKRTGVTMTYREFMGRVNAGLCEAIWYINGMDRNIPKGADLSVYHTEHKTWAPGRKPDRHNYTTESGRSEARRWSVGILPAVYLPNMQRAANGRIKRKLSGVRKVQRALNVKYDAHLKVDGLWGKKTTQAYKVHQRAVGNPPKFVDGVPGPNDLRALGRGRFRTTGT